MVQKKRGSVPTAGTQSGLHPLEGWRRNLNVVIEPSIVGKKLGSGTEKGGGRERGGKGERNLPLEGPGGLDLLTALGQTYKEHNLGNEVKHRKRMGNSVKRT